MPETADALLELPGVGPYTAAAVASIAYGEPVPVVDGNVERVLARVEAMEENARTASGRRRLLRRAELSLDQLRPGDFNQALMELGATICTPKRPDCQACPVSGACSGFRNGRAEDYPVLPKRAKPTREQRLAVAVRNDGRLLMSRRPDDARQLAGVWELPWVLQSDEAPTDTLSERYGGAWRLDAARVTVRHSITTRSLEVAVATGDWQAPEANTVAEANHLCWLEERDLESVPTTSLVTKALAALEKTKAREPTAS